MHAGLGLRGMVLSSHGVLLYGWELQNRRMSMDWMVLMAALNIAGAATYAARVSSSPFLLPDVFPTASDAPIYTCQGMFISHTTIG